MPTWIHQLQYRVNTLQKHAAVTFRHFGLTVDISAPFVFIVRHKLKPGNACCKIVTHETQEYLTEIHRAELQTSYFFKSHSCFLFGEVHCVGEDKTPRPTPWSTQWSTINGLPRRIFFWSKWMLYQHGEAFRCTFRDLFRALRQYLARFATVAGCKFFRIIRETPDFWIWNLPDHCWRLTFFVRLRFHNNKILSCPT